MVLNTKSIRLFDIIALTENWLDDNFQDSELCLNGYDIFIKDRCNGHDDAVLLAIGDHISCRQRTDLETEADMMTLQILSNPTCNILFSVFYRPPNTDNSFLTNCRDFQGTFSGTDLTNLVVV